MSSFAAYYVLILNNEQRLERERTSARGQRPSLLARARALVAGFRAPRSVPSAT